MSTAPPEQKRARRRPAWHGAAVLIGVLIAILGFAIVLQVRQTSRSDALSGLREEDLIGILDNQNARADHLRKQIADLENTLRDLQSSGDRTAAAQRRAREEAQALAVLLGTVPATGPGITVTITDPAGQLKAEDLLDVIEELRGAGAEAIQIGSVRVSTVTSFTDTSAGITVDGTLLTAPYHLAAIGGATTLDTALNIPGGVAAAVRSAGGQLSVHERATIKINVTRALPKAKYAKPSH